MSLAIIDKKKLFHMEITSISQNSPNLQLLTFLEQTSGTTSNVLMFVSRIELLSHMSPPDYHAFLSIDALTVLLLYHFPSNQDLSATFNSQLSCLFVSFLQPSSPILEKLQIQTTLLLDQVKQVISQLIGTALSPSQVFILLTCTELFQNLNKVPIALLVIAITKCQILCETSRNLQVFPLFYSLLCNESEPYLPKYNHKEHTLVLDLDETLGHCINGDFLLRPGVHKFIREMNELFELVLFTAAGRDYADWAMEKADPEKLVMLRLYRGHIKEGEIKDLSCLGRDINKVVIVDNFGKAFQRQPSNGILIKSWLGDMEDRELEKVAEALKSKFIARDE